MWFWFALGSAVFAALTSILAKVGIRGHRGHGLGHGVPDAPAERVVGDQSEELGLPRAVRSCYRCILALLLQGLADGGRLEGRAR